MYRNLSKRRRRFSMERLETRRVLSANPIVAENQLPGNPASEWDIVGIGDPSIQGYATDISVDQGETVEFKIDNQNLAPYRLDIYRIGYYGGDGARLVDTVPSSQTINHIQPAPLTDAATGLVDAGNWSVSASWDVPESATSGVYIAKVTREDTAGASHIIFVVRDDDGQSDLLFQTSDTTWQAYNRWGGNSFYVGPFEDRAYAVSYNRPFDTRQTTAKDWFFSSEYAMVRWLERNGYDVSYTTGVDSDRRGHEILEHEVFVSVAHDEYWSAEQRENVEAARDAGVDLAFFSGNEVYWKTRWEDSIDVNGDDYRTLVSYKETWSNAKIDPLPDVWTGTWRDDRFSPPADGGNPENALTGQIFTVNRGPGGDLGTPFTVDDSFSDHWFWRNTRIADLEPGQSTEVGDYVLGYEWDEDLDNGFRPPGLIRMSSTTQTVPSKIDQYGTRTTSPGQATHSLTLYRAESGALVFGAGTINWSWGLDGVHDVTLSTPDPAIQQATVNLFADMGVQPATLQLGLVAGSMSTDLVAPTSSIVSIADGATVSSGVPITISGTATESGGGVLGGVEISTDDGVTWYRASGGAAWSYDWTPTAIGPVTIYSRAVDDNGNLETVTDGVEVTVALSATDPTGLVAAYSFDEAIGSIVNDSSGNGNHGSIDGASFVPGFAGTALQFDGIDDLVSIADSNSLDLSNGMTIEAWVRPSTLNGWTTVVLKEKQLDGLAYSLYASDDTSNPPASYVNVEISDPIFSDESVRGSNLLELNQWTHLVSTYDGTQLRMYANGDLVGQTSISGDIFASSEPLRIGGNEVFGGEFFDGLIDEVRIYDRPLNESEIAYDMSTSVAGIADSVAPTGSIQAPLAGEIVSDHVNIQVDASDDVAVGRIKVYLDGQLLDIGSDAPFQTSLDSTVIPNGLHTLTAEVQDAVGNLTVLNPVSFQVQNSADVVAPIVTLKSPNSNALVSGEVVLSAFSSDNVAVQGVQFQIDGVDVGAEDTQSPYAVVWDSQTVFDNQHEVRAISRDYSGNVTTATITIAVDNDAPTITAASPAAGATEVPITAQPSVTFSEPIIGSSANLELRDAFGNLVSSTLHYDEGLQTLRVIPDSDLSPDSTYLLELSGVSDPAGNQLANQTWQFDTEDIAIVASLWDPQTIPSLPSANDPSAIELGVRFQPSIDGYVTGIRFYKGLLNTGTHVGNLWSEAGDLIASIVFDSETSSGWQQANFASPVAVDAATTYIASYFAPNGGYAVDSGYFSNPVVSGPLSAAADGDGGSNGLYLYGSSGFPTNSFNATNYWVDLVFTNSLVDSTAPTVTSHSPNNNSAGVDVNANVRATFSEPVQAASIQFQLEDENNQLVPASVSYDAGSRTVTLDPNAELVESAIYTATISSAADSNGNVMSPISWSFTTGIQVASTSLWFEQGNQQAVPSVISAADNSSVELGMKFQSDRDGFVTGIHFYKGPSNVGTHVGNLWTDSGALLASATFTAESSSGWQSVSFATPVEVTANATYVASYFAPNGGYSFDAGYFNTAYQSGPLVALANGTQGGNGLYRYGGASAFPSQSYNAANYWVDVAFAETLSGSNANTFTQTNFAAGQHSGTVAIDPAQGILTIESSFMERFDGNTLDSNHWTTSNWSATGNVLLQNGNVSVSSSQLNSFAFYPSEAIEGLVNFAAAPFQHFGLATGLDSVSANHWAMFSTGATTDRLFARVNELGFIQDIDIGPVPNEFHSYQVRPTAVGYDFLIDDVVQTSITASFPPSTPLRMVASAFESSPPLVIDSIRVVNVPPLVDAVYLSTVLDAGVTADWQTVRWTALESPQTVFSIEILVSDLPDLSDASWIVVTNEQDLSVLNLEGRYLQYRVTMSTSDEVVAPRLLDIELEWITVD